MGQILFQLAAWISGWCRFAAVILGMYGSIRWAPQDLVLESFLASAFVLPGALAGLNLLIFDGIRKLAFGEKYGSKQYRRSVRNSVLFAGVVGAGLVFLAT